MKTLNVDKRQVLQDVVRTKQDKILAESREEWEKTQDGKCHKTLTKRIKALENTIYSLQELRKKYCPPCKSRVRYETVAVTARTKERLDKLDELVQSVQYAFVFGGGKGEEFILFQEFMDKMKAL